MRFDLSKLARLAASVERKINRLRAAGAAARTAGMTARDAPYPVGSWTWTHWLEGFTSTEAPVRSVEGGAFNMTPAEEVERRTAWLLSIGIDDVSVGVAVAAIRRGYTPAALGRLQ